MGAAAVLSLAIASAQTVPSGKTAKRPASNVQRITVTGCVMQGILTNATTSNATVSRSGSPSNEAPIAGNRNGTAGISVFGSTSTGVGTSGTNPTRGGNIDTEAHGAGTLGATDQAGSTVGAGATAGVTGTSGTSSTTTVGRSSTTTASSYQLSGMTKPSEYSGKRVEVTGTVVNTRVNARSRRNSSASSANNAMPMLFVTSVRVLSDTCR
jgi:hypothetical protein